MPVKIGQIVTLFLFFISAAVLAMAITIGWNEVTGFGGRFATAALYLPTTLDFSEWFRVPRSWMMLSLLVGVILLLIVNIELILRSIITLLGGGDSLKELQPPEEEIMAE